MTRSNTVFSMALLMLLCSIAAPAWAQHDFKQTPTRVFTMTNASEGNEILVFSHRPTEGLVQIASVASGGNGSGGGLGNQNGLVLSNDLHWLIAVNAGSNSISVFRRSIGGLTLVDTVDSQGELPVSIAQHRNLLYVLNAGSDSIAGFTMDHNGKLSPLAGSVRGLSGTGTAPAQISFAPWDDVLIVTEKATNQIISFMVDENGLPGEAIVTPSAGETPFGFAFDRFAHLIVSEAAGGAEDASSVSSYAINDDGTLTVLAAAVPTTETAACWVAISRNGRVAFTTNTGSSTISALAIRPQGELKLINEDGVAAQTGSGSAPIDLALSRSGRYLFALSDQNGTILSYRVIGNKRLIPLPGVSGLPTTLNGLAAF